MLFLLEMKMYWQITPYHNSDADCACFPAETEADHRAALEYAQERLEMAWDQLTLGMLASVTIELCNGEMPENDVGA